MFLETTFGVELSRADINGENFRSIDALAGLIAKHVDG